MVRKTMIFSAAMMLFLLICFGVKNSKIAKTSSGDVQKGVEVPVIMYHSILKDREKSGAYIITPEQLEEDLRFLKYNGYNTIFLSDIKDFVYNKKPLPERSIVLTFDDGHYNNKSYALPLLEKYDMRAVISVVGEYTDLYTEKPDENPNYAYLSWDNISELLKTERIEIQNHSDKMHSLDNNGRKGCKKKPKESYEEYKNILLGDCLDMQKKCKENIGYEPEFFTYPFGVLSEDTEKIIKEAGFCGSVSCIEGMNYFTGEKEELYLIKRFLRTNKRSVSDILTN